MLRLRKWISRARFESVERFGRPASVMLQNLSLSLSSNATQGLLEALELFVIFCSSSRVSLHASHYLGYVREDSLRLRLSVAHDHMVFGGLFLKSLLISRCSSNSCSTES